MNALDRRRAAQAARHAERLAESDAEREAQGKEIPKRKSPPPKYLGLMAEVAWLKEQHASILAALRPEEREFVANPFVYTAEETKVEALRAPAWAGPTFNQTVKGETKEIIQLVVREDAEQLAVIGNLGKAKVVRWIDTREVRRILWPTHKDSLTFFVGGEEHVMNRTDAMKEAYRLGPEIERLSNRVRDIIAFWPTYPKGEPLNGCPVYLVNEYEAALAKAEDLEDAEKRKTEEARIGTPQVIMMSRKTVDAVYQAMRGARGRPEQKKGETGEAFAIRVEAWVQEATKKVKFPELYEPDSKHKLLPGVLSEVRLSGEEHRKQLKPVSYDREPVDKPNRMKVRGNPAITFKPDARLRYTGIADAIVAERVKHGK